MKKGEVHAAHGKETMDFAVNVPENIEEAFATYGREATLELIGLGIRLSFQLQAESMIQKDIDNDEIMEALKTYFPIATKPEPEYGLLALYQQMEPDVQEKFKNTLIEIERQKGKLTS